MTDPELLKSKLAEGIKELQFNITDPIQQKLIQFIELLYKWNLVHNLTAIRDPQEMIQKHVLDSLVLLPFLKSGSMVDVGTGPGLPGIPLALNLPLQEFVLLDSNQKKITFVQHVILSLKLTNVRAICARVEAFQPVEPFDWVVSRAFASLSEFVRLSGHLCKNEGKLIAMKGNIDPAELANVSADFMIESIYPVKIPGLEASRNLVFIKSDPKGEKQ